MTTVYNHLINDKKYMDFIERYNELEARIKRTKQQGIDSRVTRHYAKKEAEQLEKDYVEYLQHKLADIQEQKRQARLKHERPVYDDPQQEMLRRQDMEAKLNNMSQDDLKDLVRDTRASDITIYDFNLIKSKLKDTAGVEQQLGRLKYELAVDNNEDYKALEEQETAFYQLHGGFNGQQLRNKLYTFSNGDMADIKDIQVSLAQVYEQYRVPAGEVNFNNTTQFMKHHSITDEQVNEGVTQ